MKTLSALRSLVVSMLVISFLSFSPVDSARAGAVNFDQCRQMGNNSLQNPIRYEDSGHIEDWSKFLKPIGSIRTIVIPIDFVDARARTKLSEVRTNMLSVSSELSRLSKGRLRLEIEVLDRWVRLPRTADFYMKTNWERKINDTLIASDPLIDFNQYDLVLMKVDETNLIVDVSGALPMWEQSLPDGVAVIRGAFLGTDWLTRRGQSVQMTVHEIMHVFGLPDLYMANLDGTYPVGIYDLMSHFRLEHPLRLLGWHKWKLGWLEDEQVECLSASEPTLLEFSKGINSDNIAVVPVSEERVIVLERFLNPENANRLEVIAYTVDTKSHVWASAQPIGKHSPVNMLRPIGSRPAPKWADDLNLGISLHGSSALMADGFKIESKSVNGSLWILVVPENQAPIPFPRSKQRSLSAFAPGSSTLTLEQKRQVRAAVLDFPNAEKFVCTGIRSSFGTLSENILVRKRAKEACNYAAQLNPALSVWFQSKKSNSRKHFGNVLLTIKTPAVSPAK